MQEQSELMAGAEAGEPDVLKPQLAVENVVILGVIVSPQVVIEQPEAKK
jgi:hypothetical protein